MQMLCVDDKNQPEGTEWVVEGELYNKNGEKTFEGALMYCLDEFNDDDWFFSTRFIPFEYPTITVNELVEEALPQ